MPRKEGMHEKETVRGSRSKQSLRVWLRLLTAHNLIETQIRRRLQEQFRRTLPQFDVLAELEHAGEPQTMSQLSRQLMVSNGNLTGVVDRLERDGLVAREASKADRRVQFIQLTDSGKAQFSEMAVDHERWLTELLLESPSEQLHDMESQLKDIIASLRNKLEHGD